MLHQRLMCMFLLAALAVLWVAPYAPAETPIPAHPNDLKYDDLKFDVPPASQFREVLSNGTVVFMAEDRMLPLVDIGVLIRAGAAFEPVDKVGLAGLVGEEMTDGGTKTYAPAELDEKLEYLAASISSAFGDTAGSAALSCLSKDLDEGLGLLMEVLRYPRFDEERLRLAKERRLQNVKRRNDSTATIEAIEWNFLMYGDDHFSTRYPSSDTIRNISQADLFEFHKKYVHPGNMIITAWGDFDRKEMLEKLEATFGAWPVGETAPPTFPAPNHQPKPGVYVVDKPDVNQARVSLGHRSIERGSPDEFPLLVANAILGGGGFRSRLMAKVRSDEGLAYSVGSTFGQGVYYPDDFRCFFQTKSNACAYAAQLTIDEIKRLQNEPVSQEELDEAVSMYVEMFPQQFSNRAAVLNVYAQDEHTGRDSKFWQNYVKNLKSVTPADVQRVAKEYLHPNKLVIVAVGNAGDILLGGHDKAPTLTINKFGEVTRLQPRDPDTLKR
jgi:zinc protease